MLNMIRKRMIIQIEIQELSKRGIAKKLMGGDL